MIRPRDTRWTLAAAAIGALALLVSIAALVARSVSSGWQPLIIAAAFAHQLMWAAPVSVLLLVVVRRWHAAGAALLVLALVIVSQAPLYRGASVPSSGRLLTVLQANLKVGAADPQALVHVVDTQHVDVLMTEELTGTELHRLLAAGLGRRLPHRFAEVLPDGGGGLAIWSRFPLAQEVNHDGYQLGVLSARAQVSPTQSVTLFAIHLLPPYPYAPREWSTEISALRPLLGGAAASGQPVLAGGDFNSTTDNAQFRALLRGGYTDAAEHSGAGYQPSYPTDRWFGPVIAIDHVLSVAAPATDTATVALPGSDHRGLLVHVRLAGH